MPSASCCFLLVFYIAKNQYQTESKCSKTYWRFFWTRRHLLGQRSTRGGSKGSIIYQGTPRSPGAPRCFVPTSVASRTASLPYKLQNIPKLPKNNPRSEVPPPQASVATKNQSNARSGTLPEGEIITGGHLHHPMISMMRREQSTLGAEGLYR